MPARKAVPKTDSREKTLQVGLRIPLSVLERIDRHAARLREQTRAVTISRTDAALALILHGLEVVERDSGR